MCILSVEDDEKSKRLFISVKTNWGGSTGFQLASN